MHSADPTGPIDTRTVLKLGLGGFASPIGALWLAVCGMLVFHGLQRLQYALKSRPLVVQPMDVGQLRQDDFVRIRGRLEYERRVSVDSAAGGPCTLTPLADSNGRLYVFREGPAGEDAECDVETMTGRIAARDWSGQWDLGGRSMDVPAELAKQGVEVPKSTLVLLAGDVPRFQLWPTLLGAAGAVVWLWFAVRGMCTLRLLTSRERLAAEWQRLEQSEDEDLHSLRVRRYDAA
jgi:hypothetical protein